MKTHLFKIQNINGESSLGDVLSAVEALPLEDRNMEINGFPNRIEDLSRVRTTGNDLVLVNFGKLRMDHGPGRAARTRATEGFELGADEGFSEETAALFDLARSYVIVEYNHHGARGAALADYLNRIGQDVNFFEFLPKLDETVMQQYEAMTEISKFEVKVAPRKLSPSDKNHLSDFREAFAFAEDADAPSITLTLGGLPGQRTSLGHRAIQALERLVAQVQRDDSQAEDRDKAIKTLKVSGRQDEDTPSAVLDLIKGKVSNDHDSIVAGSDRRFPIDDRFQALQRDHRLWRHLLT